MQQESEFNFKTSSLLNYLAHAYLSGKDKQLLLGNFIADAVKGKYTHFSPEVQQGILLHRQIDTFTDHHPVVSRSLNRLYPRFHKFAGVVADMYYDHFLAVAWKDFSDEPLEDFAARAYEILILNFRMLPPRAKRILPFMIAMNWLVSYSDTAKLARFFSGMARRTNHESGMENAVDELLKNYDLYREEFSLFFPDLIQFVNTQQTIK